jgi:hypothetical protein
MSIIIIGTSKTTAIAASEGRILDKATGQIINEYENKTFSLFDGRIVGAQSGQMSMNPARTITIIQTIKNIVASLDHTTITIRKIAKRVGETLQSDLAVAFPMVSDREVWVGFAERTSRKHKATIVGLNIWVKGNSNFEIEIYHPEGNGAPNFWWAGDSLALKAVEAYINGVKKSKLLKGLHIEMKSLCNEALEIGYSHCGQDKMSNHKTCNENYYFELSK